MVYLDDDSSSPRPLAADHEIARMLLLGAPDWVFAVGCEPFPLALTFGLVGGGPVRVTCDGPALSVIVGEGNCHLVAVLEVHPDRGEQLRDELEAWVNAFRSP